MMSIYDWDKIKIDFETTTSKEMTIREMAKKHSVKSPSAITKKAKKNGWKRKETWKQKRETKKKAVSKNMAKSFPAKSPKDKRLNNSFWKARSSHGRNKIFSMPEILLEACQEYFQWMEDNPLHTVELVKFQGNAKQEEVPKMRAMTLDGLHIFLDISNTTWVRYREDESFCSIIRQVEKIIRTQKFQGAAADLLNSNIIARELGLAEKKEHTGKDGGPIETKQISMTQEEIEKEMKEKGIPIPE